ncbi:MAG: protein-ADP-ribose hydrolase [Clostridia bacterium]
MDILEKLQKLNDILLKEMPQYKNQIQNFTNDEKSQERLFRSLVNVRPPKKASNEFLSLEKDYLQYVLSKKGVVSFEKSPQIEIWQGDITRLSVDAIVNAGNEALLGCFYPCHGCIDNAIHTHSGVELRLCCDEIMKKQNLPEKTGQAKITPAFNLPCKNVIHTVGPIVSHKLTKSLREDLRNCYISCLEIAQKHELESIAFCCISTGEFHFPNKEAGEIAVSTVKEFVKNSSMKIIFNVFKDEDREIYEKLLK